MELMVNYNLILTILVDLVKKNLFSVAFDTNWNFKYRNRNDLLEMTKLIIKDIIEEK